MNFDRELDARKGELIESLQELIRIKSVGEEAGAHPFGDGPHACLMACLALGERLGFRTARVDDMAGYVEFGTGEGTVISREYSSEWSVGIEPYYPINNDENNALYQKYEELARGEKNVIFGDRLGKYKYYDMDKVIESALEAVKNEF